MLYSFNVQVSYIIVCDININTLTIFITINIKDESIKTIAIIDYKVKKTFIHKDLIKQY